MPFLTVIRQKCNEFKKSLAFFEKQCLNSNWSRIGEDLSQYLGSKLMQSSMNFVRQELSVTVLYRYYCIFQGCRLIKDSPSLVEDPQAKHQGADRSAESSYKGKVSEEDTVRKSRWKNDKSSYHNYWGEATITLLEMLFEMCSVCKRAINICLSTH